MKITNWGKYPEIEANEVLYRNVQSLNNVLTEKQTWIPRAMGRCYGDSALGKNVISSLNLNRMLDFDNEKGILTCEAGVTFEDILKVFVPKGWFPPVTPGTKFVSMGGAIASDVHGKNHHKEGSISNHIIAFELLTPKGEVLKCSQIENQEIFRATFGGMGLTGLILSLTLKLKKIESSYIKTTVIKTKNLAETFEVLDAFEPATYTVSWTDCLQKGKSLGRSHVMKGEHVALSEIPDGVSPQNALFVPNKLTLSVPFDFPAFALNPLSVQSFNFLYYNRQLGKKKEKLTDYDSFFYPLDAIYHWNRIYGKRGFTQYQFVIPKENGLEGMREVIERIATRKMGSFLVVLKSFGEQEGGYLSFPQKGYTLAMDFAIDSRIFGFLDELDKVVLSYGGKVYLTKDVRLSKEVFEKMYPEARTFLEIKNRLDPEHLLSSFQSQRIGLSKNNEK